MSSKPLSMLTLSLVLVGASTHHPFTHHQQLIYPPLTHLSAIHSPVHQSSTLPSFIPHTSVHLSTIHPIIHPVYPSIIHPSIPSSIQFVHPPSIHPSPIHPSNYPPSILCIVHSHLSTSLPAQPSARPFMKSKSDSPGPGPGPSP